MKKQEKETLSKMSPNQSEEVQAVAEESKGKKILNAIVNTVLFCPEDLSLIRAGAAALAHDAAELAALLQ